MKISAGTFKFGLKIDSPRAIGRICNIIGHCKDCKYFDIESSNIARVGLCRNVPVHGLGVFRGKNDITCPDFELREK